MTASVNQVNKYFKKAAVFGKLTFYELDRAWWRESLYFPSKVVVSNTDPVDYFRKEEFDPRVEAVVPDGNNGKQLVVSDITFEKNGWIVKDEDGRVYSALPVFNSVNGFFVDRQKLATLAVNRTNGITLRNITPLILVIGTLFVLVIKSRLSKKNITVFLFGAYGQNNIGDEAILSVFVKHFKKRGFKIYIASRNPDQTRKVFKVEAIDAGFFGSLFPKVWALLVSDYYIVGGGTMLVEHPYVEKDRRKYFRRPLYFIFILTVLANVLNKKMILSHIGVSPLETKLSRVLAKYVIKHADLITVRDESSLTSCLKFSSNGKNIYLTADATFAAGVSVGRVEERTEIIIFPNYYTFPSDKFLRDRTDKIIALLINSVQELDQKLKITLIPMRSGYGQKDDYWLSKKIVRKVSNSDTKVEKMAIGGNTQLELIARIRRSRAVITQRLHGAIFSTLANKKFIALNLDPKIVNFVRENPTLGYCQSLYEMDMSKFAKLVDNILGVDSRKISKRVISLHKRANAGFEILDKFVN